MTNTSTPESYPTTTAELIARGRQLATTIADATKELKLIESTLKFRALAVEHDHLIEDAREGRRATLADDGETITVLFGSDMLKSAFDHNSPLHAKIAEFVPSDSFRTLFIQKVTHCRVYSDGHKFRLASINLLGERDGNHLIDLLKDRDKNGIVKNRTVVEWLRKSE